MKQRTEEASKGEPVGPERKIFGAYKQSIHLTMRGSCCVQGRCIADQRAPAGKRAGSRRIDHLAEGGSGSK